MLTIKRPLRIEWGDCDPAGIVYFPRYFELFDASTAVLLERAMGMIKREANKVHDFVGYPMIDCRARFHAPSRFGDDVVIESQVTSVNRSSFEIAHRLIREDGTLAVEGFETRVWVGRDPSDADNIKSKPIPEDVAARLRGEGL
jgi:4-hydroxybenzoyl-CoA thioesterase